MTRSAHFVGSLPPALMLGGDLSILQWFAEHRAGAPVDSLPCDLDPNWLVSYLFAREHVDAFELMKDGGGSGYDDMPQFRVRPGQALRPEHVTMGRVERLDRTARAFTALQHNNPDLMSTKLQVSQPLPLDMALLVLAGAAVAPGMPTSRALANLPSIAAALRVVPVFTDAVLTEMAEVTRRHRDRISWQVESPVTMLGMVKSDQLGMSPLMATLLTRPLVELLTRAHSFGAHMTLHLCFGDYEHRSLLTPSSLAPAVTLLNRLARQLRRRTVPLPVVHIPCAHGAEPPSLDPAFYAPLARLDSEWDLIAGVASAQGLAASVAALDLFENASSRRARGVATACGFGRSTVEQAETAAAVTAAAAVHDVSIRVDSAVPR